MTMKKILILYVDNGDVKNIYKRELMWKKVVKQLSYSRSEDELEQAKTNLTQKSRRIAFGDGTMVLMMPIGNLIPETFVTHIYVTDEVYDLPNGHKFATEVLIPIMTPKNTIFDWQTEDKEPKERLLTFSVNSNNDLDLKKFNFSS
jgi:hypothetical protein